MARLAIIGSRNYNNKDLFYNTIDAWIVEHGKPSVIISGGCKGADKLAESYAHERKIPIIVHSPDWYTYGKAAGPIRNNLIINDSTFVIAFPEINSVGTYNSINLAKQNKIPTLIVKL